MSKGVAATVVSEATQSETADEFVTRIVIDCAGNVGPLGDAIKAAGRGGDREVFAALQHKLGNSAAAAVMARAGRHTATATSLSKGNATIDRKTEESFQHDGGGVKNTRAVHGSVGKGGASGSASMSKHATAKDSTGQVVDSKTTTAAVAGSADHGSVDVAHEHTTDNKGKAITKAAKAHGEIGDKGPAGSASLSKKTETKTADGHVVATKATSAHAAGSADGGSLEVSRANSSDHNGQHRESSTAAKGAIDKDGPSGSIDRRRQRPLASTAKLRQRNQPRLRYRPKAASCIAARATALPRKPPTVPSSTPPNQPSTSPLAQMARLEHWASRSQKPRITKPKARSQRHPPPPLEALPGQRQSTVTRKRCPSVATLGARRLAAMVSTLVCNSTHRARAIKKPKTVSQPLKLIPTSPARSPAAQT